jgi:hypothetical protein
MDRPEVRTAWLEPDAVCLIDQTKPAHTGVSSSRRSKLQGQVYSLKLSARGRIMCFEA